MKNQKFDDIKNGINLEKFINDENCSVRIAVAKYGYGLNRLARDKNKEVREIAKDNKFSKEINPENYAKKIDPFNKSDNIKLDDIKQGINLEKFIDDDDRKIRVAVANQGYGLEILSKDNDKNVRNTADANMKKSKSYWKF